MSVNSWHSPGALGAAGMKACIGRRLSARSGHEETALDMHEIVERTAGREGLISGSGTHTHCWLEGRRVPRSQPRIC